MVTDREFADSYLAVRVPRTMRDQLKWLAEFRHHSDSAEVREAIRAHLARHEERLGPLTRDLVAS